MYVSGLREERSAWTRLEPVKALRETDELRAYAQRCPHIPYIRPTQHRSQIEIHTYIPYTYQRRRGTRKNMSGLTG